jgi:putative nucleotidyltransferase with HDIG domain
MPVPTRSEAIRLLLSTDPSPRLVQHATVVAEVASFLAYRAQCRGIHVDRRLVETAALLHDVDKAFRDDDPLRRYPHGRAGAEYVAAAGHPELARAVAAHPVMRLGDDDAEAWVTDGPLEERIVSYADKRGTERVVSIDQRFDRWYRSHPDKNARLALAHDRARRLESVLCDALGVAATDIERLRWVDEARSRAALPAAATRTSVLR